MTLLLLENIIKNNDPPQTQLLMKFENLKSVNFLWLQRYSNKSYYYDLANNNSLITYYFLKVIILTYQYLIFSRH
jgi:hypothetical protein